MNKIELLTNFKSLTVGEEELTITGLANAQTVDRVGDIIVEDAYKKGGLDNYLKNPIILFNHDYSKPIGKATDISVGPSGLTITAKISKAAGDVYHLIKDEIIKAFSVGFMIKDADYDAQTDILKITDIELYEVSAVAVPANADSIFNISKQLNDCKEQYKKQFAQSADDNSASAQIEEKNMDKLQELQDLLASKDAELKAAESIIDEAAKREAAREAEAKEKAALEAVSIQVNSQVEKLLADVEKRFEEEKSTLSETLKGLETTLQEKAEEIQTLKANKMNFEDHGSRATIKQKEKEDAILISKLLGKDIRDTKFFQNLVTKSGLEHTPTAQWEEEFNTNIYNEMREKLVVEPLFGSITMNQPLMNIPINPEAGDAQWISSAANPYLNQRGASSTGTNVDHKLGEITLQAYKLASKEYIGYEEEEDTILSIVPIIRDAIIRRMARTTDQSLLRGTGAGTGGDAVSPFKGLTQIAEDATVARNTTTVSVGAKWTVTDLQSVRRQLGKYGLNPGEVKYLVSQDVYYDLLEDPDFRTIDMVGTNATILTGQIGYVNGSVVIVSDSFAAKAATAPAVVAVYTGNFYVGNLRTMMVERDTDIEQQKRIIVATRRLGFVGMEQDSSSEPFGCATGVWAV
jgi:HK97 family phage prohead protease/HK97 family phage major capsid protein